jgi:UDP-N-acetylglucosamine--N-acetylmuramyl-(pentapeptide) pyrophosphoryl-undecaprenol N-acetylglucosamine transferase
MPELPSESGTRNRVVIACGGTGGHLFPGLAVGQEFLERGCAVTVMISPKDVDQQAIQSISDMTIVTLPAVGSRSGLFKFVHGLWKSYHMAVACFAQQRPRFVLAMGGFISAPPIIAARRFGAKTFLHESNSIPGRANRWLARVVDGAFVFFPPVEGSLAARRIELVGMPVRPQFVQPMTPAAARTAMGLQPDAPTLLVMGGSQGAAKINEIILAVGPQLREAIPNLQFIHLTGMNDVDAVRAGYKARQFPAVVHAFWKDMGTALAAADVAVSRAGASSLAELAARQLPAVLIPYPSAADNHQYFNARAFVQSGAARMLQQHTATPESLAHEILELLRNPIQCAVMKRALVSWHSPTAARDMAELILNWPEGRPSRKVSSPVAGSGGASPYRNSQNMGSLNV